MNFIGLQKTSLVDFPDRISSILFTPYCNLRCPFCHNWRIVIEPKGPFLCEEEALQILDSRKKYISSIVFSGGEPTMNEELPIFLGKVKEKGFKVKIDTNGFFPQILKECLPFTDYIAMDIKTSIEKYSELGTVDVSNYLETIQILMNGKTDYEFRNTVVPGFVEEEDLHEIGKLVKNAKRFIFQKFIPGDTLDKKYNDVKPHSLSKLTYFTKIMKNYVKEVILRV